MNNPFDNLAGMMQQAQKFQEQFKNIQNGLADVQVTGESGAGMVKATINGKSQLVDLVIDDSLLANATDEQEKQVLTGLIKGAINDSQLKMEREKKEKMKSVISSMGLPAEFLSFMGA